MIRTWQLWSVISCPSIWHNPLKIHIEIHDYRLIRTGQYLLAKSRLVLSDVIQRYVNLQSFGYKSDTHVILSFGRIGLQTTQCVCISIPTYSSRQNRGLWCACGRVLSTRHFRLQKQPGHSATKLSLEQVLGQHSQSKSAHLGKHRCLS